MEWEHFLFGFMNSCIYFFNYRFIIDTSKYNKINCILDELPASTMKAKFTVTGRSKRLVSKTCFHSEIHQN